jgi:beta-glucosidase
MIMFNQIRVFSKRAVTAFLYIVFMTAAAHAQQKNYVDRNGNGIKDVYEDITLPLKTRLADLLKQMTLEEKVGQMVQYPVPSYVGDPKSPDEFVTVSKSQTQELKSLIEKGLVGSVHANLRLKPANVARSIAETFNWLQQSRLKIPFLVGVDAVHGNALAIGATVFPSAINIAASFDENLCYLISDATAKESVVLGQNWNMGPNIEVARDMRWGRIGETFGEDPLLVSRLGVASINGYQKDFKDKYSMAACAKHFIGGSEPADGRNNSPTDVSERTLREVFYPPFLAAFKTDVAAVMLAHNEVNGIPCHSDSLMIRDWIKSAPGFSGLVISDYMDVQRLVSMHHVAADEPEAFRMAVKAGMDMNMMGPGFFEPILKAVKAGDIPMSRIDEAASRILTVKFKMGLFDKPDKDLLSKGAVADRSVIGSAPHLKLALEAAAKSIVLLKNSKQILPLQADKKIFLTGPLAANEALLGDWVAPFENAATVTPLKGLKAIAGNNLNYYDCGQIEEIDDRKIAAAVSASKGAEVCIVVVGQNPSRSSAPGIKTEGENIDRSSLSLPGKQAELVKQLALSGRSVVVVYLNGGPIADPIVEKHADGIIEAFYPGQLGGQAIAEIIYGKINPSAKMPYTVPRSVGHMNSWYYQRSSKFSKLRGKYALEPLENGVTPLYDFGHGLSYTQFAYSRLNAPATIKKGESFDIAVKITNTGAMDGDEIATLFMTDLVSRITTPAKLLIDFKRVSLKKGQSKVVTFQVKPEHLMFLNEKLLPELEAGEFQFELGDKKIIVNVKNDINLK